jgi:hypothetical protein
MISTVVAVTYFVIFLIVLLIVTIAGIVEFNSYATRRVTYLSEKRALRVNDYKFTGRE